MFPGFPETIEHGRHEPLLIFLSRLRIIRRKARTGAGPQKWALPHDKFVNMNTLALGPREERELLPFRSCQVRRRMAFVSSSLQNTSFLRALSRRIVIPRCLRTSISTISGGMPPPLQIADLRLFRTCSPDLLYGAHIGVTWKTSASLYFWRSSKPFRSHPMPVHST